MKLPEVGSKFDADSQPEDKPATIDVTATTGDAEEVGGDGPIVVRGDGTRAG